MTSTVLILGARGRFGRAAAQAFCDAGWRVIRQCRPGVMAPPDPRVQWLNVDLQQTLALQAAAQGAAVVVNALNPPYTNRAWRTQAPVLMDGAIRLSRALGATLMLPGNVYNFGEAMPALLHEATPQEATTVKGKVRVALEQQLLQADLRSVVIRAGDFFGAGRGSWFDQVIVKDIRKGKLVYPGATGKTTPWAYLPDLARCFVAVAEQRSRLARFEVLHFAGHQLGAQDWQATLSPLACAQGWIKPAAQLALGRVPWSLMRIGAPVVPTWQALLEMRYLWQRHYALANERLLGLIGAEPHTPLPLAAHAALSELGLLPAPLQETSTVVLA